MRELSLDGIPLLGRATVPRPGRLLLLVLALFTALSPMEADAELSTFVILPEKSQVGYISATQLGEFRGTTGRVSGDLVLDVRDPVRGKLSVAVDPKGLRSDNAVRDRHMYEEVFEVARFPAMTFTADQFKRDGSAEASEFRGTLLGTLALHGVDQAVSVPIRFTVEGTTLRGEGKFSINLSHFGITPPRLLGLRVRNEVVVEIRLVAAKR
jgi:polyisoprenoid-binding protein YceI